MIGAETWGDCLLFLGIMFLVFLGCELIKDDAKVIYQSMILLINAAVSFVLGAAIFSGNVEYYSYGTMQYSPIAWVFMFICGVCFIMMFVTLLKRGVKPFDKAGKIFPHGTRPPRDPEKPPRAGGW